MAHLILRHCPGNIQNNYKSDLRFQIQIHDILGAIIAAVCGVLEKGNDQIQQEGFAYIQGIKYIHDHIHKGHGQATTNTAYEIENYVGARYLGPIESSWSISGNFLHNNIPTNLDSITSKDRSEYPHYRRRDTRRRSTLSLREPGRIRFARKNTNCGIHEIARSVTNDESSISAVRDAWISAEKNRLTYYRIKQKSLRVQMYSGLTDLLK